MRIIQSYWSCNRNDLLTNQPGWLAPEYNLISWALSCLQLKSFYKKVILYCDYNTKAILIDELKLPYDEVYCELDQLNHYHPELWALPKIHCYSRQTEPFLHVDGDVFIWKPFEKELLENGLISQNLECATVHYDGIMEELEKNLSYFPDEIIAERKAKRPILAYNAGILGGHDIDFYQEYCTKAIRYIEKNKNNLHKIKIHNFNIFFEQYLFYCLAKNQGKKVGVLMSEVYGDNEYKGFGDFMEVPHNKQYLHILGTYKRSDSVCIQLANNLRLSYPDYYYRIINLYKKLSIPLLYDYYHDEAIIPSTESSNEIKLKYLADKLDAKLSKTKYSTSKNRCKEILNLNEQQRNDLKVFLNKTEKLNRSCFSNISHLFLYGRDLCITGYYEHLFGDLENIYTKTIVVIPHFEVIKSQFDWSKINNPKFYVENHSNKGILTLIVPECHQVGYSLFNVDMLDLEILEILKTKKTIGRLLNDCKMMFNKANIEKSKSSYEKLIFGRIKKGIYNKVIKVVELKKLGT